MIIYSRTTMAQDQDGNLVNLSLTGPAGDELKVQDTGITYYIQEIIDQLKINNFHLSLLTENFIKSDDIPNI